MSKYLSIIYVSTIFLPLNTHMHIHTCKTRSYSHKHINVYVCIWYLIYIGRQSFRDTEIFWRKLRAIFYYSEIEIHCFLSIKKCIWCFHFYPLILCGYALLSWVSRVKISNWFQLKQVEYLTRNYKFPLISNTVWLKILLLKQNKKKLISPKLLSLPMSDLWLSKRMGQISRK